MLQPVAVALSLTIMRFPFLFLGTGPIGRVAGLVPLVTVAALTPRRIKASDVSSPGIGLAAALALVIVASAIRAPADRSGLIDVVEPLVLIGFGLSLLVFDPDVSRRSRSFVALALAPGVYSAANLLLVAVGFAPQLFDRAVAVGTPDVMLGYLGLSLARIQFPLAGGVNPPICAVGLAAAGLLTLQSTGRLRVASLASAGACIAVLLATDSRGGVAGGLAALTICVILRRRESWTRWAVALAVLSPVVIPALLEALGGGSGGGERAADTATGRIYMWKPALEIISSLDPSTMLGWGGHGQIASGAWSQEAYLWGSENIKVFSQHNFMLQTVLDVGYVGLAIIAAVMFVSMARLGRAAERGAAECGALVAGFAALILAGLVEAAPVPEYSPEAFAWFVLVAVPVLALRPELLRAMFVAPARSRGLEPSELTGGLDSAGVSRLRNGIPVLARSGPKA